MSFTPQDKPALGISATERETGLGKDTLRVWERRYGFPQPQRDANGERLYPAEQVDRLRLIKRLMDQGHRPGRLMAATEEDLQTLYAPAPAPARHDAVDDAMLRQLLALVKSHDVLQLRSALNQAMLRQGLQDFVLHRLVALNHAVGEAWMSGEFEIFEEHLYTEQVQALLRQAIATLPTRSGSPRILLTTLPEEQHGLGLLMAEALLALDGATCVSLGTQTPLYDIAMAARSQQADVVALSFSSAYPSRQIAPQLAHLRTLLPEATELWAGGSGVARLAVQAGIRPMPALPDALGALAEWRARHGAQAV
jgi:DNA-binding transcriptional MerR regulator/methylmalonyl-CoA mutase cobalamin-binding subunit